MITSVELGNFLSHSNTKLDFDEGVTVFVGPNGAGKSSIIDAITFALFGRHTRKSNKGLIRRGTNQAYTKVNFLVNGRNYEAVRKIEMRGALSAHFVEKKDGEIIPLAVGERKQFGESMTKEIEARIGLDFDKLKIASIVQQGELNSIIKAKPKEFKELLNTIIGIDKLDMASDLMKTVQRKFRESIRNKLGYDDTYIETLKNDLDEAGKEIEKVKPLKHKLLLQKQEQEKQLGKLQDKIEEESPKETKLIELEARKADLARYAKEAISSIQKKIEENERKVRDCEGCFEYLNIKKNVEAELQKIESELEEITKKTQELYLLEVKLKEQESLAGKLKLKDGRCPICNSEIDHLNPLYEEEHLKQEASSTRGEINSLTKKKDGLLKERNGFAEKLQKIINAETTLRAHSIRNPTELEDLKKELYTQKSHLQKIPQTVNSSGRLIEMASIDSHSRLLYDKISELEKETEGFDAVEFRRLKNSFEEERRLLSDIDQQLGALTERINTAEERLRKFTTILEELGIVKKYVLQIEEIQNKVFNRDGAVAVSLRSWARNTISSKSSEYLTMLNTKIHRISLSEKTRDVSITCYTGNTALDLESLSGGERVSVALAIRLGMTHLLGASNLNFVILDEPTTHLDEEHRKSLVNVFSQLSDIAGISSKSPLQFIIITHDSEIFENSAVDRIYKFESSVEGTKVTAL